MMELKVRVIKARISGYENVLSAGFSSGFSRLELSPGLILTYPFGFCDLWEVFCDRFY